MLWTSAPTPRSNARATHYLSASIVRRACGVAASGGSLRRGVPQPAGVIVRVGDVVELREPGAAASTPFALVEDMWEMKGSSAGPQNRALLRLFVRRGTSNVRCVCRAA